MKFLTIFCLFLLVSCQNNPCGSTPEQVAKLSKEQQAQLAKSCPTDVPVEDPQDEPSEDLPGDVVDVPAEASLFNANLTFSKFDASDVEKVERAVEIIKKVIQGQEFKDKVLSHKYNGKPGFVDSKKTNAEIYASLIAGMENLLPEVDHEMDLDLELYYSSKNTVGYTYPSGLKIWMNTKYFDVYTPAQVAGNLFHEWTHKLGYEHAIKFDSSRDYSVPYALGYLIRDLGKKYE